MPPRSGSYDERHDYDRGDRHFRTILSELTAISTSRGTNILSIGSPDLFRYPLAYMAEPGQADRKMWGILVLFFLAGFFVLALMLKTEYWKDVK